MHWLESIYFVSIGFAIFGGLTFSAFSIFERDINLRSQYIHFSLACFTGALFQYLVVAPIHLNDLSLHIQYQTWRTTFGNIALFFIVAFFTVFTGQSQQRYILTSTAIVLIFFSLIEIMDPGIVKYGSGVELEFVHNEHLGGFYRLMGTPSTFSFVRHGFFIAMMIWIIRCAIGLWHKQQTISAIAIVVYTIIQLSTFIYESYLASIGNALPMISGFGFYILITIFGISMAITASRSMTLLNSSKIRLEKTLKEKSKVEKREKLLAHIFDNTQIPNAIVDDLGDVLESNAAFKRLCDSRKLSNIENIDELFHKTPNVKEQVNAALAQKKTAIIPPFELQCIDKASVDWFEITVSPTMQKVSSDRAYLIQLTDVSESIYVENAIRSIAKGLSNNTGQSFYEDSVIQLQKLLKTDFTFIGEFNDSNNPTKVATLAVCQKGQIIDNFQYDLAHTPCSEVSFGISCVYPSDIQTLFPQDVLLQEMNIEGYIGSTLFNPDKRPIGLLVALHGESIERPNKLKEITEIFAAQISNEMARVQAENEIRKLAFTDYLTELPNKAVSHDHLKTFLGRLQKYGQYAWMALFDFDHFKRINDALGYDVGDEVIREIGSRLSSQFNDSLFISRISGDEFMIISKAFTSEMDTHKHMQNTLETVVSLINTPINVGDHLLNISASIGAVKIPSEVDDHLDAMRAAEIAVYKAKESGRNSIVEYATELHKIAVKKLSIEKDLRVAIKEKQFQLYYQPQFSNNGVIVGSEGLIRWIHPTQGLIPPNDFVPISEEAGLIHQIGETVQAMACQFITANQELLIRQQYKQHIAINISAWEFAGPSFVDRLVNTVNEYGVAPELLTLELTESSLLSDIADARRKLESLREKGFSISLDDFGTGYSSLAYLRQLPVDSLKIDKSFIDKVEHNQSNPLVESMIAIGRNMDIEVVAEGVETQEQLTQLSKWGCECFQGYYFSKPLPESQYIERLEKALVLS